MRYDKRLRKESKQAEAANKTAEEIESLKLANKKIKDILEGVMHEVRRFNTEVSSNAEELIQILRESKNDRALDLAETVYYTAGLISSRMTFSDHELNPQALARQIRVRAGIYRKFDKARHVLAKNAKKNGVDIRLTGKSSYEIDALQAFELVPFVIIDNAIKYSPKSQPITIKFDEISNSELYVTVSSLGPTVPADELPHIFERGFRGSSAEKSNIPGDGLGLYLASTICQIHNIKINADSSKQIKFGMNGSDYSEFSIKLCFLR